MENTERVLAYQLAKEIEMDAFSLAGGSSQQTGWHMTYSMTGSPGGPVCLDVGIDWNG